MALFVPSNSRLRPTVVVMFVVVNQCGTKLVRKELPGVRTATYPVVPVGRWWRQVGHIHQHLRVHPGAAHRQIVSPRIAALLPVGSPGKSATGSVGVGVSPAINPEHARWVGAAAAAPSGATLHA